DRRPGTRVFQIVGDDRANLFRHSQTVARIALRGRRVVLRAVRRVFEHGGDALYVMWEASRRKHDAASRDDLLLAAIDAQDGTANLPVPCDQPDGGRGMEERHLKIERAAQEPGDERIAVDELHAATM